MHAALAKLFRLRIYASWRRMFRNMRTVRGAVVGLVTLSFFAFIFFQGVVGAMSRTGDSISPLVVELAPIALIGLTLVSVFSSAGERAIYFSPSEVDFLFAGPFTRRQLLIYKLSSVVAGAAVTALIISFSCMAYLPWWPSSVAAIFTAFLFMNAVTLNIALIGQTIAEAAYTRGRKLVGGAVITAIIVGATQAVNTMPERGISAAFVAFADSTAGAVLLAPAYPFQMLLQSSDLGSLVLWLVVCGAIDAVLLGLAIRVDANYLEAAANISRSMDARLRRVRRGGAGMAVLAAESHRSIPRPPRLAGVGTITWVQLSCGLRGARGFLFSLIIIVVSAGSVGGAIVVNEQMQAAKIIGLSIGAVAYLSFLISMNPPLGFRANFDQIPLLKTLPLRPTAIACGQTLGIAAIVTMLQWMMLTALMAGVGYSPWLLWAAAIAPSYNVTMFALDNLTFLVHPTQLTPGAPGDVNVIGRSMVQSLIKVVMLLLLATPPSLAGLGAWAVTDNPHAFPLTLLALSIPLNVLLIVLVGFAFRRFDPSLDQPA